MSKLRNLLGPMRVPFLTLALSCVTLGLGTALWTQGGVNPLHFLIALIAGIASHISVNAFNEYFDFKSGLDARTHPTPFSGGSGTLPRNPALAPQALTTAIVSLALTCLAGLYFFITWGWGFLPLGLLGALIIVVYTPWLTRNPWLCLVAPGLGFGILMVMGVHFALTGEFSWTAFFASLTPFFLVADLLLLNQFPDVEADQSIGRYHLLIFAGKHTGMIVYGIFLLAAYLSIVTGVLLGFLPSTCLVGLITLLVAVPTFMGVYRDYRETGRLIPHMAMNVFINIATPVLLALGLLLG